MKLDRHLQLAILTTLKKIYPDALLVQDLPGYAQDRHFMGNMLYLKEHSLITGGDIREPGKCRSMIDAELTREGLDFLEDDGGIKAILDQSVIRFERDDILSLFLEEVIKTTEKSQQTESLWERLQHTPADILKKIIEKLLVRVTRESPELLQELIEESQIVKGSP